MSARIAPRFFFGEHSSLVLLTYANYGALRVARRAVGVHGGCVRPTHALASREGQRCSICCQSWPPACSRLTRHDLRDSLRDSWRGGWGSDITDDAGLELYQQIGPPRRACLAFVEPCASSRRTRSSPPSCSSRRWRRTRRAAAAAAVEAEAEAEAAARPPLLRMTRSPGRQFPLQSFPRPCPEAQLPTTHHALRSQWLSLIHI